MLATGSAPGHPLSLRSTQGWCRACSASNVDRVRALQLGIAHSDHRLVRDYTLAPTGARIRLYAGVPYAVEYGWPGWVTGVPADPFIDIDAFWEASCRRRCLATLRRPTWSA